MERDLKARGLPFDSQPELSRQYKDHDLSKTYRLDFICYGKTIVELKAVSRFEPAHKAQVINYLKATGLRLGLLVNFGSYPKAKVEGIIL